MPTIAQQDYLTVDMGLGGIYNYESMAILSGIMERGQIFDTIIVIEGDKRKVVSVKDTLILMFNAATEKAFKAFIDYSPVQYQGLAAIQKAEGDTTVQVLLIYTGEGNRLFDDESSNYICVDDKYLLITVDDSDNIVTITVSDTECSDEHVNISYDDAQKLIGVFAGN